MELPESTPRRRARPLRCITRCLVVIGIVAAATCAAASDWGMGAANSRLAPPDMFNPVSTPAYDIETLAWFAIAVCAGIALVVGALLAYSIIRFRSRAGDEEREPPQVYGSNP